ncbi:hypothetical protein AB7M49_007448 [Bradyrhizobium elkanii]|jgi:hypothetical protein|uniref:Uncharacterized protein n=1 Tax=Bradyrhizobium elkanii TaxID=29448 RepID=A0A8I2C7L4_BRAEL|nr:hypothetical protein [Bradyrhizobium elkanii]MCS4005613.1 hypothetical protein [Bradyrhizobium elkanii USDA 61]MCP1931150.1 hypothetical protein [Bradyrhizobium elkanii]MCS3480725.1 hypothetical protein [Bradyrhizobium elkanii]MCS3517533.1 hypothetical protein [Bradyrhizobium elkanii]
MKSINRMQNISLLSMVGKRYLWALTQGGVDA